MGHMVGTRLVHWRARNMLRARVRGRGLATCGCLVSVVFVFVVTVQRLDQSDQAVLVDLVETSWGRADACGEDQTARGADDPVPERNAPQSDVDERIAVGVLQGAAEATATEAEGVDHPVVHVPDDEGTSHPVPAPGRDRHAPRGGLWGAAGGRSALREHL